MALHPCIYPMFLSHIIQFARVGLLTNGYWYSMNLVGIGRSSFLSHHTNPLELVAWEYQMLFITSATLELVKSILIQPSLYLILFHMIIFIYLHCTLWRIRIINALLLLSLLFIALWNTSPRLGLIKTTHINSTHHINDPHAIHPSYGCTILNDNKASDLEIN